MKLKWNFTTALIVYSVIGLILALALRFLFFSPAQVVDNTPPIGKTILILPESPVPATK
jgi:hypothetical protein